MQRTAQSIQNWLSLTENWIYNQLVYLDSIESIVLCYATKNLSLFPWDPLYEASPVDHMLYKFIRRFHIPYQHIPKIFVKAVSDYHPKILHSHFGYQGWFDIPLVNRFSLKHLVTYYGFDVTKLPRKHPIWKRRYRELFDHVDLILCEGPHMANAIMDLGCPQSKVVVHRIGIDLNKISYAPRKFQEGECLKFLIASTFREKKGIPDALEAIGRFNRSYSNIEITIIGEATSEKGSKREKQKILSMIEKYNLIEKTKLMGYQPYSVFINEAYRHHIFLSPSITASDGDTEGGAPISLIEMMASGIPIVSTNHCDIPQIIIHERTGLLAAEHDIDGLVRNISWWVENPEKWDKITWEGRKHIEENFDVRIQSKKLEDIYESL